jgi:hypothetical protein
MILVHGRRLRAVGEYAVAGGAPSYSVGELTVLTRLTCRQTLSAWNPDFAAIYMCMFEAIHVLNYLRSRNL